LFLRSFFQENGILTKAQSAYRAFFALHCLLAICLLHAQPAYPSSFEASSLVKVAALPAWHSLIKVRKSFSGGFTSDLTAGDFYLASGEFPDPLEELLATIQAFQLGVSDEDEHAQCRFPARLHWLKQQLPALNSILPKANCPALQSWIEKNGKQQFHLVHVSGYFYNPASAFGHLLLRVGDGDSLRGLTDLGINFGARIPPEDGSFKYILKGLFGGYEASFSTKQHYLQDKVYAGVESRDMWAYELKLTQSQSALLSYYLWELTDRPFKYFFLKRNCAYRIAEALELVFEVDFIKPHDLSYAPVKLFNRLYQHDQASNGGFVKKVRFIPSHERESNSVFAALPEEAAKKSNEVLRTGDLDTPLSVASLDFLLGYFDYKIQSAPKIERASVRELKRHVLRKRLKIPDKSNSSVVTKSLRPPGNGSEPSTVRLGVVSKDTIELEVSPFLYDVTDQNRGSLIDSSFQLLALQLEQQESGVRFNKLTLLEIQNFGAKTANIHGESNLAWRAGASVINREECSGVCLDGLLTGGVGRSWKFGRGLYFSTVNTVLSTSLREQRLGVSIGSLFDISGSIRGFWESEYTAYSKKQTTPDWSHKLEIRYSFLRNHAADFALQLDDEREFLFGYRYKF